MVNGQRATNHVTADPSNIHHKAEYGRTKKLFVGNGYSLNIFNTGSSFLNYDDIALRDVLHVPHIKRNLLIIRFVYVKDQDTKKCCCKGPLKDGLYQVSLPNLSKKSAYLASVGYKVILGCYHS